MICNSVQKKRKCKDYGCNQGLMLYVVDGGDPQAEESRVSPGRLAYLPGVKCQRITKNHDFTVILKRKERIGK